jgi:hypothetical protein
MHWLICAASANQYLVAQQKLPIDDSPPFDAGRRFNSIKPVHKCPAARPACRPDATRLETGPAFEVLAEGYKAIV